MKKYRNEAIWLIGVATALWASAGIASAQPIDPQFRATSKPPAAFFAPLPLNQLPPAARGVIEKPTVAAQGPVEGFYGRPELYAWLQDNPDRGVACWHRLGAKCADIQNRGNGRFGWSDDRGSDVTWTTICRTANLRVWYAEGIVNPGPMLPNVPFRGVVLFRYSETKEPTGRTLLHHQCELYVQTDSKAATVLAKLLGASAPRLAEQCTEQMELFYSVLVWYCDQYPDRAQSLLSTTTRGQKPAQAEPTGRPFGLGGR